MRSRINNRAGKAIGILALMLGLTIAVPASATAKAGGTDRPFRSNASGTVRLDLATNAFVAELEGPATHGGRGSVRLEGTGAFRPDFSFAGTGEVIIVAANGDELHGDATLTTTPFTAGDVEHTTTVITTITGGTGRFDDATGTLTSVQEITPMGVEGTTLINRLEGPTRGHISY